MKRLGIIQPGKIGDIVICLPIAKWYYDRGYSIIWPIDQDIIDSFFDQVPYVQFIPIKFDCKEAINVCVNLNCTKIIDLAFTLPNANQFNTDNYIKQVEYTFDEFKYFLAGVPFDEKWKLSSCFNRMRDREDTLYNSFNIDSPYVLIQDKSSDTVKKVEWTNKEVREIRVSPITDNIFDWLKLFENAKEHVLIESCFSNLIDQLNIKVDRQRLLLKHGYYGNLLKDGHLKGIPRLKLEWEQL